MNTPCCWWCLPVAVEGDLEWVCQLQHRCGGWATGRGLAAAMDLGEMASLVLRARSQEDPGCPVGQAVERVVERFWCRHGPERKTAVAGLLVDLCDRWLSGRIRLEPRGGEAGGFRYVFTD